MAKSNTGAFMAALEAVVDQGWRGVVKQDLWYERWAETGAAPWGYKPTEADVDAALARALQASVRQLSLLIDCQADAKPDSGYWWQLEGLVDKVRQRVRDGW